MFQFFHKSFFRQLPKSSIMRMVVAFLLLSVQVFSHPANRGSSSRYSGYPSNSPYGESPYQQEYKNVKIIDEEPEAFLGVEELDPQGFIPGVTVKPLSPITYKHTTPAYKHTTPVYKHTTPSYKHTTPLYKHRTQTHKPAAVEEFEEVEEELFEDQIKRKLISSIKAGIKKQINEEVVKEIVDEEKRRFGIVDLLWKIVQVFLERRQLPRCAGLRTSVTNSTRGQTIVTIGNLSAEGREDLYEEISCEVEEEDGGEKKDDEDGGEKKDDDDDEEDGSDEDSDESGSSEEEPDGDGGGILGILVGLSGEGGMSDLGTLLTTVSGIITNLSGGPEFDLDTIIGSAVGLFASVSGGDGTIPFGKLSAQYYITSFEGFSGGGAMMNGKFIGDLLNGIITGSSLVEDEEDYDAEPMKDSIAFYRALFAALFGSNSENGDGGGDGGDY